MRLKTLEIKGFKSFADQTIVNFEKDVIGIVGPNGSGKSNIVDAVRWVLGEQKSRELRLDKMTSVIFNGTKKRKAGGVASVTLTFENTKNILPTEYQEVSIARLLYRSGDSEYRLNGTPCRLKDITSLFLDTGIGSNSYAIIALGMVDDILADKENARRRMFEQAAGISKYKVRKRETINKLNATTADLERVEDLLFEIEGNLKTLEKQAKRTKRYFELKEKYKAQSVELATIRANVIKERQKTLKTQLDAETDRYRQHEVDIAKLEATLEYEKKANLDKEQALSARQRELNELVGDIRERESNKRMLEQRIGFAEGQRQKLTRDLEGAGGRTAQLNEDITGYQSQLETARTATAELTATLDERRAALDRIRSEHGDLKTELDRALAEQQTAERAVYELEKGRAVNQNQIQNLRADLERRAEDRERRRSEVASLRERFQTMDADEAEKIAALQTLEAAETQRRTDLDTARERREAVQQDLQKLNRTLDAQRNEYQLTKSMVENMEGFPESIQFLSRHKKFKGKAPLLYDLVLVEERYRVAIEALLEPYLNYYVAPDHATALAAVQLLGDAQRGKANFFLLDQFPADAPGNDYETQKGYVAANTVVDSDEEYQPLLRHLLRNVFLTDEANATIADVPADMTLLSESGRIVRRGRALSGGSVGLFEGKKIGRKKNLEVLDKSIKKAEKEAQKLTAELKTLDQTIRDLRAADRSRDLQRDTLALNKLANEKIQIQTRLENFEGFLAEMDNARELTEARIQELETANVAAAGLLTERQDAVATARTRIAQTDGTFRRAAEELSAASAAFNEQNIATIRQQNLVEGLEKELRFREQQLEEVRRNQERQSETLERTGSEIADLQGQVKTLETDLLAAYDERKAKGEQLTTAEQTYFAARGQMDELDTQIRQLNRKKQDSQVLVNQMKDKFQEGRFQLTSLGERLRVEFQVELNDIINNEPSKADATELQIKTERLGNRLANYGEINPLAVEAYDEMNARYETIQQQRTDIVDAKDNLMATIKEIEDTATAQFLEAFDQVRLYFIDIFRSLFTEDDNADLILLDPENPLDSKIEIVAKPKGKRPQSISQLSGGEKTLTATALLFALYLLKPAPFCIFDEVDAPLDDANIEKFNRIIKKFSADSQFIIVTHNKATMAAVDVIYGVYMQEQGVSAVTPVDFSTFAHRGLLETA